MRACVDISNVKDTDELREIKNQVAYIESASARKCFRIKLLE